VTLQATRGPLSHGSERYPALAALTGKYAREFLPITR
jgi:hypothetical protein